MLDKHNRLQALIKLNEIEALAPEHPLTLMSKRALASYDQNPLVQLDSVKELAKLYPGDDRSLNLRIQLLRFLGNHREATSPPLGRGAIKPVLIVRTDPFADPFAFKE